eukprot:gnl/MRDRNA2_/MRDRNA2_116162_c0_seq1.p1 gnl/MRDRNA2_/MRDRNA2_116162_c0~~gnl/MRDRNA2_/MRDRNA2_116162_c0_seq1.p1  ORF type:complete len:744 (-),score=148.45 gnl/MRDRNA2_/MRDRNA2_116162_c0_seq1:81-2174(-)
MAEALRIISGPEAKLPWGKWMRICQKAHASDIRAGIAPDEFHYLVNKIGRKWREKWQLLSTSPGPPPSAVDANPAKSQGIESPEQAAREADERVSEVLDKVLDEAGAVGLVKDIHHATKKSPEKRKETLLKVQTAITKAGSLFHSRANGAPTLTLDDMKQLVESITGEEMVMDELTNSSGLGLPKNTEIAEGDMPLPPGHLSLLDRGVMQTWPGGVMPYCFAADMEPSTKEAFLEAIVEFEESVPCLTFKQVGLVEAGICEMTNGLAVHVQSSRPGCWSYVGPTQMGQYSQPLNLGNGCGFRGIAAHELAHAAGMAHEHSRPDRDKHIKIHYENLMAGKRAQFDVAPAASTAEPYAFDSLMHYGPRAFGKRVVLDDGTVSTLQTIEVPSGSPIGQRMGLALADIHQFRRMYGCPGTVQIPEAKKIEVLGACDASELNGVYHERGRTADGRPWYEHMAGGRFLYFDQDCSGAGAFPRWQFDGNQPNESAKHDVDGDSACTYAGRINVQDMTAPLGQRRWSIYCGAWQNQHLIIQNASSTAEPMNWSSAPDLMYDDPQGPELLSSDPPIASEDVSPDIKQMTLRFNMPISPGHALGTHRFPRMGSKTHFASILIRGNSVIWRFGEPLEPGTRYMLDLSFGAVQSADGVSMMTIKKKRIFSTQRLPNQTGNLSDAFITWNSLGAWVEKSIGPLTEDWIYR